MTIQHNIEAMNTYRQMNITGGTLAKSARNLSSGYKINIAADDAAGLSISEKMRKQIRGLTQASANSEDGISMVQVADGAMAEVHDMLDRCIELSIQAANGTLSDSDRVKIQDEIDQIINEIDGIQERTKFNEVYVLKGEIGYKTKKVGTEMVSEGILPEWVKSPAITTGKLTETYTTTESYITTATTPSVATAPVNHYAASMDFSQFDASKKKDLIGKGFNTTCCTCTNYYSIEFVDDDKNTPPSNTMGRTFIYKIGIRNVTTPEDLIRAIIAGTDYGNPKGHYTKLAADPADPKKLWVYDNRSSDPFPSDLKYWQGWTGAGAGQMVSRPSGNRGDFGAGVMKERDIFVTGARVENPQQLALQVGADAGNLMHLRLATISRCALDLENIDVRAFVYEEVESQDEYGNISWVSVKRIKGADDAIKKFTAAKDMVSKDRSRLGAYQNRLEHTVNNLDNVVENTTAAESQIRDTDMAREMVRYSNANIMMQAGQSMLSQANQSRQGILSLLAA